jgi:hypothetical protein
MSEDRQRKEPLPLSREADPFRPRVEQPYLEPRVRVFDDGPKPRMRTVDDEPGPRARAGGGEAKSPMRDDAKSRKRDDVAEAPASIDMNFVVPPDLRAAHRGSSSTPFIAIAAFIVFCLGGGAYAFWRFTAAEDAIPPRASSATAAMTVPVQSPPVSAPPAHYVNQQATQATEARQQTDQTARLVAEEAHRQKEQAEQEARRQANQAARHAAEEAQRKKNQAEQQARRQADQAARHAAEESQRQKNQAEQQARQQAEQAARGAAAEAQRQKDQAEKLRLAEVHRRQDMLRAERHRREVAARRAREARNLQEEAVQEQMDQEQIAHREQMNQQQVDQEQIDRTDAGAYHPSSPPPLQARREQDANFANLSPESAGDEAPPLDARDLPPRSSGGGAENQASDGDDQ